ncbi:MAG: hypothetical protein JSW39_15000 [Desulfobacterales bacterium]|nr:MAG: hypothetical protein JSW39_15000 [Desulfobacterales bacterium]
MPLKDKNDSRELFRGVLLTHLILLLHLLVIALLGLLVIFFRSVTQHLLWVVLGGIAMIYLSGYFFYRRFKLKGKETLHEMNTSPLFKGRSIEVSFLGGIASVKFGQPANSPALDGRPTPPTLQLEDPASVRLRELEALTQMFEKRLITPEEFNDLKKRILKAE